MAVGADGSIVEGAFMNGQPRPAYREVFDSYQNFYFDTKDGRKYGIRLDLINDLFSAYRTQTKGYEEKRYQNSDVFLKEFNFKVYLVYK